MSDFLIEKEDTYKGYKYYVVGYNMGHRCGYVVLPRHHPLYHADYNDDRLDFVRVHGGLTYSDFFFLDKEEYVLGFDCAHCFDAKDEKLLKYFGKYSVNTFHRDSLSVVRSTEYVEGNCKSLIDQIKEHYPLFEDIIEEAIKNEYD